MRHSMKSTMRLEGKIVRCALEEYLHKTYGITAEIEQVRLVRSSKSDDCVAVNITLITKGE